MIKYLYNIINYGSFSENIMVIIDKKEVYMEDKNRFQEMLTDILEVARVQENRLSTKDIKSLFGDMELSEAQYEHIYAYLVANHITIEGYVGTGSEYSKVVQQQEEQQIEEGSSQEVQQPEEDSNCKEDSIYLKMYLQDLEAIKDCTLEENTQLIEQILKGDHLAKNRFIEVNLRHVVKIAEEYKDKGLSLEDLIQEGNIGLMTSVECLSQLTEEKEWTEFVTGYVRCFIVAALEEQKNSINFEDKIINKINYLNSASNELAEDMGREPDIHELVAYTKMTEEEILDILNMSVDAVKVRDLHQHNHGQQHKQIHKHHRGI